MELIVRGHVIGSTFQKKYIGRKDDILKHWRIKINIFLFTWTKNIFNLLFYYCVYIFGKYKINKSNVAYL